MYKVRDSLAEIEYNNKKSDRLFLIMMAVVIALAILLSIIFNTYLFFVKVDGSSMLNTFVSGETVVVNKTKSVNRGDVVIIDKGSYLIIKRAIALEGDKVRIEDGKVYLTISGEQEVLLEETYVKEQNSTYTSGKTQWTVGKGQVFYMGDNRVYSRDARQDGCCKTEEIIGVVTPFSIQIKSITTTLFGIFGVNTATE